ncbi:uncharacterized protein F5Z01DRAFT_636115 [Emericellopsis atlantica]|uniref:Uncharacterized protein n=1 Tax=Emericellopsis atlantica TaxID=2614577 RepID=A0A9P7ZN57_9HYPO|nr:uncharacterized protein F5Z01DRAFT_636115 [Emericellopsis atlantica]KAG9254630.1 hypothetical protein F5Z01DRAFT_636115 [Emericellopsis atlantica]
MDLSLLLNATELDAERHGNAPPCSATRNSPEHDPNPWRQHHEGRWRRPLSKSSGSASLPMVQFKELDLNRRGSLRSEEDEHCAASLYRGQHRVSDSLSSLTSYESSQAGTHSRNSSVTTLGDEHCVSTSSEASIDSKLATVDEEGFTHRTALMAASPLPRGVDVRYTGGYGPLEAPRGGITHRRQYSEANTVKMAMQMGAPRWQRLESNESVGLRRPSAGLLASSLAFPFPLVYSLCTRTPPALPSQLEFLFTKPSTKITTRQYRSTLLAPLCPALVLCNTPVKAQRLIARSSRECVALMGIFGRIASESQV